MAAERPDLPAVRQVSERLLVRAATRNEYLLSVVRTVFCGLGLARYLVLLRDAEGTHLALSVLPYVAAGAFSVWILLHARRRSLSLHFFYASVVLDWLLCLLALLPNVLWPWPSYTSIVYLPDIGIVYLIILASALRLSPKATLLSGALNLGSFIFLIGLDWQIAFAGLPPAYGMASMVVLLGVISAGLATVVASRTRRLVEDTGLLTWRQGMAQRTLNLMLEEHHGTRSLLSAAKLHADHLLERSKQGSEPLPSDELNTLHHVLSELVRLSIQSRERSFAELASLRGLRRVELLRVAEGVARVVAGRYPHVQFTLTGDVEEGDVAIVGGNASFERILLNLLTNACEGDGQSGANNVEIHFEPLENGLRVSVRDDGPGFPDIVRKRPHDCITTKANGTGIGLYLVERLLRESEGTLTRSNRVGGGAEVTVTMPELDSEVPPQSADVETVVSSVQTA